MIYAQPLIDVTNPLVQILNRSFLLSYLDVNFGVSATELALEYVKLFTLSLDGLNNLSSLDCCGNVLIKTLV